MSFKNRFFFSLKRNKKVDKRMFRPCFVPVKSYKKYDQTRIKSRWGLQKRPALLLCRSHFFLTYYLARITQLCFALERHIISLIRVWGGDSSRNNTTNNTTTITNKLLIITAKWVFKGYSCRKMVGKALTNRTAL